MKKALGLASVLMLALGLAGCASKPDSLVRDQIKQMDEFADALEKDAPEAKLKEISKRMEETAKKLEDLKLSEADKKALTEKHKDELSRATQRVTAAVMKKMSKGGVPSFPGVPGFGGAK